MFEAAQAQGGGSFLPLVLIIGGIAFGLWLQYLIIRKAVYRGLMLFLSAVGGDGNHSDNSLARSCVDRIAQRAWKAGAASGVRTGDASPASGAHRAAP